MRHEDGIGSPTMNEWDMAALVAAAQEGDKDAFGVLYEHLYVPIYRYALFRLGTRADAEDLAQDVFLKAYRALPSYDPTRRPNILPFLFTIARNAIIDRRRRARVVVIDPDLFATMNDESIPSPVDLAAQREDATVLYRALRTLSDDMRDALTLRFMGGLATAEVAQALGKTPDAVRQLQSRGIRILREKIESITKDI